MSQMESEPQRPHWSLGWRLRRALEWGNVPAKQMAEELDVSDGTISRWCHDVGAPPKVIYLRAWAHRCRVPEGWLLYGDDEDSPRRTHVQRPETRPKVSLDTVGQYAKAIRMGIPLEQRRKVRL